MDNALSKAKLLAFVISIELLGRGGLLKLLKTLNINILFLDTYVYLWTDFSVVVYIVSLTADIWLTS